MKLKENLEYDWINVWRNLYELRETPDLHNISFLVIHDIKQKINYLETLLAVKIYVKM